HLRAHSTVAGESRHCEVPVRQVAASTVAIIVLTCASASPVIAASSRGERTVATASTPDRGIVDRLVFDTPLKRFRIERTRAKRMHRWLITSTDGCSAPIVGSSGRSFNFRLACERHDLAYANYSVLSRLSLGVEWNASLRAKVDDRFQRDLQDTCSKRRHSERLRCDAWAVLFFHAVRLAAGP
ncbi:MAG: phospholipase A2, partial [Ilumatobacteraceae bacterium]